MGKKLALKSFRLQNFKAIRDSGVVKFTPLTVLIGDNGSGKSSLIEGLQTYQAIVRHGLDSAMGFWRGFENLLNASTGLTEDRNEQSEAATSIQFDLRGSLGRRAYQTTMTIASDARFNKVFIDKECVYFGTRKLVERNREGQFEILNGRSHSVTVPTELSVIAPWIFITDDAAKNPRPAEFGDVKALLDNMLEWQFLALDPYSMGKPQSTRNTGVGIRLSSDGSNLAELLRHILQSHPETYEGIVETMQFVLPYMRDLKPVLTEVLGRQTHLEMSEEEYKVKGWLLSTGTLRILALLALFRHPEPPPLIVIEELENGLDPRSVQLIVEEIRRVTESGRSQILLTSHSPYLLDLFDLSHIVLVERRDGAPTFTRPDECRELDRWKERFGPGRLMSSGRLRNRELA